MFRIKCKDIPQLTSEMEDSNPSFRTKISYLLHLAICGNCRRFVRQFNQIKTLTDKAVSQPASKAEVDQIMDKINKEA